MTEPLVTRFNDTLMYFPVHEYGRQSQLNSDTEKSWSLFAPLYMTALLTSRQYMSAPMDQFGNIKIPEIFQLPTYSSASPIETWFDVDETPQLDYVSLLGIPTAGLPEVGNTTFDMGTRYWPISCDRLETTETFTNMTMNTTNSFEMVTDDDHTHGEDKYILFTYRSTIISRESWDSQSGNRILSGQISSATCRTYPLLVALQVACSGRTCAVKAIRRLPSRRDDTRGKWGLDYLYIKALAREMSKSDQGPVKELQSSQLVERWIVDPSLSTTWDRYMKEDEGFKNRYVNVTELPPEVFNRHLQLALNTFWQSALGSALIMGNVTKEDVQDLEKRFNYLWNSTELAGIRQEGEKYACNFQFATITITTSLLLFAAAVASIVLHIFTIAPDTLGYVSTSARENPYVTRQIPSHLDGLEAARKLRDVRIRIGDVDSAGDVGHIAFASMDVEPKRVSRKRLYD